MKLNRYDILVESEMRFNFKIYCIRNFYRRLKYCLVVHEIRVEIHIYKQQKTPSFFKTIVLICVAITIPQYNVLKQVEQERNFFLFVFVMKLVL